MSINTPVPGVVTKGSRHTIEETFERLGTTIRAKGLAIFAFIDHSGEA